MAKKKAKPKPRRDAPPGMRPADREMLDAIVADKYAATLEARASAFAKFVYDKGHGARYEEWDDEGERPRVSLLWTTIGKRLYGKPFNRAFLKLIDEAEEREAA